jgi:hypothetical protein
MEIQPNQKTSGLSPAAMNRAATRRSQTTTTTDYVSFTESAAVNRALENTPEKRVDVIERARALVGDPTYPPRETIRRLSELLAMRMSPE